MPTQSHSGYRGIPWSRCDRCGEDYQLNMLEMQGGLLLCVDKCIDSTGSLKAAIRDRDQAIADVLSLGEFEMKDIVGEVRSEGDSDS